MEFLAVCPGRKKWLTLSIASALAVLSLASPARTEIPGQVRVLYGPEIFHRQADSKDVYSSVFRVPSFFEPPFILHVENGGVDADGRRVGRVSSARIQINGGEVARPSDFNQTVGGFEREITVDSENRLEIRLNGAPGGFLSVSITGSVRLFPMVEPRAGHTAVLLPDGRVGLQGGRNSGAPLSSSEVFDSATFDFSPAVPSLSTQRAEHTASILADQSYLAVGGFNDSGVLDSAERRDPSSNDVFVYLNETLKMARMGHTATTLLDGRVVIIGGRYLETTGSSETAGSSEVFDPQRVTIFKPGYDPATGSFAVNPYGLAAPRWDHAATLLPDGKILITGGSNETGVLDTAELFDPQTGGFMPLAARLTQPRSGHTATLLPDGRVLILGGRDEWGVFPTAEAFDPAAQTFSPLSQNLILPRAGHTASLLPSGEILVAGGENSDGVLDTGELYEAGLDDRVPPSVRVISPPDGAVEVDLTEVIGLRFSEPVDVTTLSKTSVLLTVEGGGPVDFTLSASEGGLLSFLVPKGNLLPGTTYRVALTEAVTDPAGNPLAPFVGTFTTVSAPQIDGVSPNPTEPLRTVNVYGDHFDASAVVRNSVKINGSSAKVLMAQSNLLIVEVPWEVTPKTGLLTVSTRGGTAQKSITVNAPWPSVQSISPASAQALSGPVTATLIGNGFVPTSQVEFNTAYWSPIPGTLLTPIEVAPNKIVVVIPVELLDNSMIANIRVVNFDEQAVRTSNWVFFLVTSAIPAIASMDPTSVLFESGGFVLTVHGDKFLKSAQVSFNGRSYGTVYISSRQLRANIPVSAIAFPALLSGKVVDVVVNNAGAKSNAAKFEVLNPAPQIAGMSHTEWTAGYPDLTMTVEGGGFVYDSRVEFNGVPLYAVFETKSRIRASIPPSAISAVGTLRVRVVNPGPGGGASSYLDFNSLPLISGVDPGKVQRGASHRTVRITGPTITPGSTFEISGTGVSVSSVTPVVNYTPADSRFGEALFNWQDASDGRPLLAGAWAPFSSAVDSVEFPFYVYDTFQRGFLVRPFGLIFEISSYSFANPTQVPDPARLPNLFVAPFWDSISRGTITSKTVGTAPNRTKIIQWNHFSDDSAPGSSDLTFQILIEEMTGKITYQYLSMTGYRSDGSSATVGLEGSNGGKGMAYLINGMPAGHLLAGGLAVSYTPSVEFVLDLAVDPDAPLGLRDIIVKQPYPDRIVGGPIVVRQPNVLEIVENAF